MGGTVAAHAGLALVGGLAGASLWFLGEMLDARLLPDRLALGLTSFTVVFFGAVMAMLGSLRPVRAVAAAAAVALLVAALLLVSSLRDTDIAHLFAHSGQLLAAFAVATIPVPFIIAGLTSRWDDYARLFTDSWGIVVRYAVAWVFVGLFWAVLFLSDALLSIVGVGLIGDLMDHEPMFWTVTGLTFGLALAVLTEMADVISPHLVLRLLRLLLPVVLVVLAVFILALPVQGVAAIFVRLSAGATMLAMAAAAVTLVASAVDRSDAEAVETPFMRRATQALAVIAPVPAGLAAWAVALRVDQHGWTPDRLFAALAVALALGYTVTHALAVLRGAGWMARIRRGNIWMALVVVAAAVAWLTVLNADAISASSQLARLEQGRVEPNALDVASFAEWGRAGRAVLAQLEERAREPGNEALAARLSGSNGPSVTDAAGVAGYLRAALALRPAGAEAERDRLLEGLTLDEQRSWLAACRTPIGDGRAGCVMVIGDFLPEIAGQEALVVLNDAGWMGGYEALVEVDGVIQRRPVSALGSDFPASRDAVIAHLLDTPAELLPAPIRRIAVPGADLAILP